MRSFLFWFQQTEYTLRALIYFPVTFLKYFCFRKRPVFQQYLYNRWGLSIKKVVPGKSILIFAMSGGEVTQIATFTKLLKERYPRHQVILFTEGYDVDYNMQVLKKKFSFFNEIYIRPWDISCVANEILRKVNPSIVIFIFAVFNPVFLRCAYRKKIATLLCSGVMSKNFFYNFDKLKLGAVNSTKALNMGFQYYLTNIGVCDEEDRRGFVNLGTDLNKILITGNLKFDIEDMLEEKEKQKIRESFCIKEGERIIIGGSLHLLEERLLAEAYLLLKDAGFKFRLILVPRFHRDMDNIKASLEYLGLAFKMRTQIDSFGLGHGDIILVDTFGELKSLYSISAYAFIGGSISPTQHYGFGHNPIEALINGTIFLYGPYMNFWREITDRIEKIFKGLSIKDSYELFMAIKKLEENHRLQETIRNEYREIIRENKDCVINNLRLVENTLSGTA